MAPLGGGMTALSALNDGDLEIGAVIKQSFSGALGTRVNGTARELLYELPVHSDETVTTSADASTAMAFLDETRLQVGPSSRVVLDRFVYDTETATGEIALYFGKGLFRFVTGKIRNKEDIVLRTPSASLSIRGTVLIIHVDDFGNAIVSVIEGQAKVAGCGGGSYLASAGESVSVLADCTGQKTQGRLAPRDPSVDNDIKRTAQIPGDDVDDNTRSKQPNSATQTGTNTNTNNNPNNPNNPNGPKNPNGAGANGGGGSSGGNGDGRR